MTSHIASIIVEYSDGYAILEQEKEGEELYKEYGVAVYEFPSTRAKEVQKLINLLRRFALEREFGCYQIQQKDLTGKLTGKQFSVIVTHYTDENTREVFTPWLDEREGAQSLGNMKLEFFATLLNGRVFSHSTGISEFPSINSYVSEGAGCVYIDWLETSDGNTKFRGIGSGLVQVAAEVSFKEGYGGRVLLDAIDDSPNFYKKVHFTTHSSRFNKYMKLDESGRQTYQKIIAEKPVLSRAKEENKSS